jgi:hypothetical protein
MNGAFVAVGHIAVAALGSQNHLIALGPHGVVVDGFVMAVEGVDPRDAPGVILHDLADALEVPRPSSQLLRAINTPWRGRQPKV